MSLNIWLVAGIVFNCAIGLAADDPLNGTWKIDASKSSFSNGKFPKNMSITIKVTIQGDQMTYHSVNDNDKNKPTGVDYTATMDAKAYPATGSDRYNNVSVRRLGKNQIEILESKSGDVIWCDLGIVSRRKTFRAARDCKRRGWQILRI